MDNDAEFSRKLSRHFKENYSRLAIALRNRVGGRVELSEEALADAYLKAWQYRKVTLSDEDLEKWMGRIIVNAYNNKLKEERPTDELDEGKHIPTDDLGINKDQVVKIILKEKICVEAKKVLYLRYVSGLSLKDIPIFADITYSNARKISSEFIKRLSEV